MRLITINALVALLVLLRLASAGWAQSAATTIIDVRPGAPNPVETLVIHSEILDEDRSIYVQLPEGYDRSDAVYPVLYVMDGEWLFDLANAHARYYAYDEVTDITLPRMIVVGLENTDRDRNYAPTPNSGIEYDFPTAGGADNFIRFLELELIPLIESRYKAAPLRGIVGWSNSGLFANYVATANQDLFDMYLCISPAVWWDQDMIYERFEDLEFDRPKRFVYSLGTNEEGGYVYESTSRLLERFAQEPVPNMHVSHFKIEGVGHTWGVASAMNHGLQDLFVEYIAPGEVINAGLDAVEAYYMDLSRQWRYTVEPPAKVLHGVAFNLWDEAPEEAIKVLQEAVSNDVDDSTSLYYLGLLHRNIGATEQAVEYLNLAIEAELRKTVPNEVNRRTFASSLEKLETAPLN